MLFLGIIWNPNETLLTLGPLQIKYYNLLWIVAFAIGWFVMKRIYTHEKKTVEQLDSLFIHCVVSIMLGARLGHVFFYDWEYYKNNLIEILLPIRANDQSSLFGFINGYEFTGFTGLASHGATIGAIIAIYLYSKKQNLKMLWVLDRAVVASALGTFCVRLGNFFNSEINGKQVEESFVFATKFIRNTVQRGTNTGDLEYGEAMRLTGASTPNEAYKMIEESPQFAARLAEIPYRHPVQLYEGIAYILVFVILYYLYWKTDKKDKLGYLFGLFMVLLWTIRFFAEFVKKSQGGFEETLGLLSTGQWLSIPFIIVGLYLMFRPKKAA